VKFLNNNLNNHVIVTAPSITESCSTKFTSNSRLTVSWSDTRGATQFDVQVYDMVTNKSVYNNTVSVTDVLLTKVERDRQYVFYITGLGDENQRGNTISCTGSTGT